MPNNKRMSSLTSNAEVSCAFMPKHTVDYMPNNNHMPCPHLTQIFLFAFMPNRIYDSCQTYTIFYAKQPQLRFIPNNIL